MLGRQLHGKGTAAATAGAAPTAVVTRQRRCCDQQRRSHRHRHRHSQPTAAIRGDGDGPAPLPPPPPPAPAAAAAAAQQDDGGPSTDPAVLWRRLRALALPYWRSSPAARRQLAAVVGLSLASAGISVAFSYLGRDFMSALSERDAAAFARQLLLYLGAFAAGIPVLVWADYAQSRLALDWRRDMTEALLEAYMSDRAFYRLQQQQQQQVASTDGGSGGSGNGGSSDGSGAGSGGGGGGAGAAGVDNPDQRIAADVR